MARQWSLREALRGSTGRHTPLDTGNPQKRGGAHGSRDAAAGTSGPMEGGRGRGEVLLALFDFDGTLARHRILGIGLDKPLCTRRFIDPRREEMRSLCGTDGESQSRRCSRAARYGMDVSADEFTRGEPNDVIYERIPLEP